jgi:hypothetical protein
MLRRAIGVEAAASTIGAAPAYCAPAVIFTKD